jgi:acyl-CoA synthetase (AMP-forming)/AMP-acid ligase II
MAGSEGWQRALSAARVSRIALFTSDTWDFALALVGAWRAGVAVVLPGDALPGTCAEVAPHVDAFVGDFPDALPRPRLVAAPVVEGAARLTFDAPPLGLTVFTSGSTGAQQPFEKRMSQLSAEVTCLEETFGPRVGEATVLSTVTHQHIYGLLFKVLWPLCAGRPFVSETLFFHEALISAAAALPEVALVASPAHLKRLPAFLDWSPLRDRARAVFSSGGPLAWDAAQQTHALLGRAPVEVYGSSETGGIAWRERSSEQAPWQRFADVALEVEPASRLLRVRSPKLPDAAWFQTADQAALSPEGTLTLLGRQDRVVKLSEKRVSLDAVEEALRACPQVADARVVVLADEPDRLGAVVQPSDAGRDEDARALAEALRGRLVDRIAPVGIPRRFRFVNALPLDARGKTTQAALLRLFEPPSGAALPQVLERTELSPTQLSLRLGLPASLHCFEGHFPTAKVLPGVVQLDWAQRYGREGLGVRGDFRGMESLKFQRVLQPGDQVELRLEYLPERGRLKFLYQSGQGAHSSGVLLFH